MIYKGKSMLLLQLHINNTLYCLLFTLSCNGIALKLTCSLPSLSPLPRLLPQTQPLFELRCSNNVVHVHTCADSCAALVNLLQYLVSQGDLHPPPRHTSPTEIAGQKLPVRPPGRRSYSAQGFALRLFRHMSPLSDKRTSDHPMLLCAPRVCPSCQKVPPARRPVTPLRRQRSTSTIWPMP